MLPWQNGHYSLCPCLFLFGVMRFLLTHRVRMECQVKMVERSVAVFSLYDLVGVFFFPHSFAD